jgi:CRISPR-associated protein Csd2
MTTLQNKIDFALIFKVKNANPNGDPLGGNRPRTTSDGLGEVSDVCLKRKIRNKLQASGHKIFVQMDENNSDGKRSLSERFNDYLATLSKDEQKDKNIVTANVCKKWLDVRSFGQVFAFKKGSNTAEVSLGVRGPVTIQSAFTVEPVVIESIQITKSVNSETTADGKKDSSTMGMKHRVNNAVYVTYGSISPQLAEKTGFSDADANAIKEALVSLFEGDESSARPSGSMQILQVVWFSHNSKMGQYSSAKVHNSVKVDKDGNVTIEELDGLQYEILE